MRTARLLLIPLLWALPSCASLGRPALPVGVLSRAEWGANEPVREMQPHRIRFLTIHHTATRQRPERSLAEKMRALQEFSQTDSPLADGRIKAAWPDVPYHFYVDHAGRVAEGRERDYAGDTNTTYDPTGHLLIVLEGNFEEERPTAAQMATLERLVRHFAARYGIPRERIAGHRDYADTLCPGRHLHDELPRLRALAPDA